MHPSSEVLYIGYSSPLSTLDEELADLITIGYARQLVRALLSRYQDQIEARSRGLSPMIELWLHRDSSFQDVWNHPFGAIKLLLLDPKRANLEAAVANLAMRLHYCGVPGQWSIAFRTPQSLQFGEWRFPAATSLEVNSNGRETAIALANEDLLLNLELKNIGGVWSPSDGIIPMQLFQAQRYHCVRLDELDTNFYFSCNPLLGSEIIDFASNWTDALELLDAYASPYHKWVKRVTNSIAPLIAHRQLYQSGSNDYLPGTLGISFPAPTLTLAELLVHEATHQYYFMLTRLGDVDDGTDTNQYYSPLKKTNRPINKILVAYHAVANMLFFYTMFHRNTDGRIDSEACIAKITKLKSQLAELNSHLESTCALTPIGYSIWKPLVSECEQLSI